MYHIPDDARARRSAELLYNGLMECLGHAKMTDITVTAVAHSSGCGRSTFYRLFDNPSDIAQWKCGQIMLLFVSSWREHAALIGALHRSALDDMIYKAQIDHIKELQDLFLRDVTLSGQQQRYLSYCLASLIHAAFQMWTSDMRQSSEEMLGALKDAVWKLDLMFSHRHQAHERTVRGCQQGSPAREDS